MLIFRILPRRESFLKRAQSVCLMAMMTLAGILAFPAALKKPIRSTRNSLPRASTTRPGDVMMNKPVRTPLLSVAIPVRAVAGNLA